MVRVRLNKTSDSNKGVNKKLIVSWVGWFNGSWVLKSYAISFITLEASWLDILQPLSMCPYWCMLTHGDLKNNWINGDGLTCNDY